MRRIPWWCVPVLVACGGPRVGAPGAATVEDLVWGGTDCRRAADCPSGVCTAGACVGYLGAATEEARAIIGLALAAAVARGQGEEVRQALAEVLSSTGSDEFLRGRAADAFRWLPPGLGGDTLAGLAEDPSEPVRFFAARARHARGDPEARELLRSFLRHPSEAVRMLATRALATGTEPGDQGPINQ
ncbi:MAG TPA: HEAT repeat domain-containing protein [Myxococcota bacterium]|mgnify:CR=1 FL=1|nr:HEAT repeat domain-containing protein [Myxococcota bacterium]HQK49670.1 HEAT repeat domain-containing protein [Myxococcota bacterium]